MLLSRASKLVFYFKWRIWFVHAKCMENPYLRITEIKKHRAVGSIEYLK